MKRNAVKGTVSFLQEGDKVLAEATTQPTGNSGAGIACGAIGKS